nr:immunoglobulin light chain junction region [Macaca mulatta]MPN86668.1 immunoglobulin light chain junction region [Macaca mulatta]
CAAWDDSLSSYCF